MISEVHWLSIVTGRSILIYGVQVESEVGEGGVSSTVGSVKSEVKGSTNGGVMCFISVDNILE
jgi:hypothetical protein